MIRIMIVEDDVDWIKSMVNYLNRIENMHVVAAAMSREEAVRMASTLNVDIILMDINLYGNKYDGILAAWEICRNSQVKIIMLTALDERDIITGSFAAGAIQYVSKRNFMQIPEIIKTALNFSNPMEVLLEDYRRLKEEEQLNVLSTSEKEIFRLIDKDYSNAQIEKELFKTKSTLKNQINSILKKLGVKNRREAVQKVKMRGLAGKQ